MIEEPSNQPNFIQKRFEAGIGQVFQTTQSESLDFLKYSDEHLYWNQIEEQYKEDEKVKEEQKVKIEEQEHDDEEEHDEEQDEEQIDLSLEKIPLKSLKTLQKKNLVRTLYPLVIIIEPISKKSKNNLQAQISLLTFTKSSDKILSTKFIRQKIMVNHIVYNVYDIFGIEQKKSNPNKLDDIYEGQTDCVICLSEPKTTLVLPCRHMCLCESCAESLKLQSVKCPICRGPVRSLLKIEISTEDQVVA